MCIYSIAVFVCVSLDWSLNKNPDTMALRPQRLAMDGKKSSQNDSTWYVCSSLPPNAKYQPNETAVTSV